MCAQLENLSILLWRGVARMAALDIRACGWVFVVVVLRIGLHFRGHDDESDLSECKWIEQLRRAKVVLAVEMLTAARMTGTLAGVLNHLF